jgi:hypothetical protein
MGISVALRRDWKKTAHGEEGLSLLKACLEPRTRPSRRVFGELNASSR